MKKIKNNWRRIVVCFVFLIVAIVCFLTGRYFSGFGGVGVFTDGVEVTAVECESRVGMVGGTYSDCRNGKHHSINNTAELTRLINSLERRSYSPAGEIGPKLIITAERR